MCKKQKINLSGRKERKGITKTVQANNEIYVRNKI